MKYKDDWDKAKARLTAFWNRELLDRCCAAVYVHDPAMKRYLVRKIDLSDEERFRYWTEPELVIKRNRAIMETTYYGGEAFPQIFVDLGAAGHAGFFKKAKYYFGDSVWFFPALKEMSEVEFDEDSFLYRKTLELASAYAGDSKGDYMVSMPDCTGNIDALSHLFGPGEFLPMLLEDEDEVLGALAKIQSAYEKAMRGVYARVKDVNEGGSCVGWLSTWAPGFHAQMQSDLSVMISNRMYETFVMPELRAQCDLLEYPLYHFDGIEQIRHLDSLLSLEKLRAIQWTQVDGQPPCTDFFPQLRKIQEAGKNLIILVRPEQIGPVMENLSSKGLYLIAEAETRDEADAMLKTIARLTHD